MDRSIVRMVLIETSWNVKNRMSITADKITPELIETSWNVKKKLKTIMRICRRVLIETSWNVKLYTTFYIVSIHRINRNIVECKVLKVYTTYIRIFRINRNIVECKAHKQYFTVYFCIVIIETLWNVKYVK